MPLFSELGRTKLMKLLALKYCQKSKLCLVIKFLTKIFLQKNGLDIDVIIKIEVLSPKYELKFCHNCLILINQKLEKKI